MIKKQSQLVKEREAKRLAKRVAKKKDYQDGCRVRKAKLGYAFRNPERILVAFIITQYSHPDLGIARSHSTFTR